MKAISGSNPVMYVEPDGTVYDQFFKKVDHDFDYDKKYKDGKKILNKKGQPFVRVAGEKRYIAALVLENYGDDPRPGRENEYPYFKDGDKTNIAPENLEWKARSAQGKGEIKDVGEAGKVSDDEVEDVPTVDGSEEEQEEEKELTKKEMIAEVLTSTDGLTVEQVKESVKDKYGVEVSATYISNVKGELNES